MWQCNGPFLLLWASVIAPYAAEATSPLYPHGAPYDASVTSANDNFVQVFTAGPVQYYGNTYDYIYVNENGQISFDEDHTAYEPTDVPSTVPFLTAFFDDIGLTPLTGEIRLREGVNEDDLSLARADIEALTGMTAPALDRVIVVTWYRVRKFRATPFDPVNDFQVVLAIGSGQTYAIFNYETLGWGLNDAVVVFNKGDGLDITILPNSKDLAKSLECSNVGLNGRFVARVDLDPIQFPALSCVGDEPDPVPMCTVTAEGDATDFSVATVSLQDLDRHRVTLSTSTESYGEGDTLSCSYLLQATVDEQGILNWMELSIGKVAPCLQYRYTYRFNEDGGVVTQKELGVCMQYSNQCLDVQLMTNGSSFGQTTYPSDLTLPFTLDDDAGEAQVTITEGEDSVWTVETGCGLFFRYGPSLSTGNVLEIETQEENGLLDPGTMAGLCGSPETMA